ncbi:MAG: cation:H+ antiporter [Actinomycetota bacterium]|nr:cation:H+ antiporter [Actinomycetota bacterium]
MVIEILACLLGLVLLALSSDALVIGCSRIARRLGVPATVVGVVVIGFGTSAPELLVSGSAALRGSVAIGVGNVIGSNIANLTLVLGVAALVAPVTVRRGLIRREVPMILLASAAFGLALQGGVSRAEAVLLLVGLAGCLILLVRWAVHGQTGGPDAGGPEQDLDDLTGPKDVSPLLTLLAQAGAGLVGTVLGAQALVFGAAGLARAAGLSEGFVGVTIVAIGTSLPELLTAAQAARRGENDLVIGNLLGSNLFNALGVGGLIGVISPAVAVDRSLAVNGVAVMMVVSFLATAFMIRRLRVVRWEAAVLLAVFVGYLPLLT